MPAANGEYSEDPLLKDIEPSAASSGFFGGGSEGRVGAGDVSSSNLIAQNPIASPNLSLRGGKRGIAMGAPPGAAFLRRAPGAPPGSVAGLSLEWAFGLNRDFKACIYNLSGPLPAAQEAAGTAPSPARAFAHRKVFYAVGQVGVIYDATRHAQRVLQGHAHAIVASCASHNRRFVVTVDGGNRGKEKGAGAPPPPQGAEKPPSVRFLSQAEDYTATMAAQEAAMARDPRAARDDADDDRALMIVWDTWSGLPVRTIAVGRYGGVVSCAMSPCGLYIAALNRRTPQEVVIWGWTARPAGTGLRAATRTPSQASPARAPREGDEDEDEEVRGRARDDDNDDDEQEDEEDDDDDDTPEYVRRIPAQDEQSCIRFAPDNPHLICTNGLRRVLFWSWADGRLTYYSPPIIPGDWKGAAIGHFTQTVFIPGTTMACSGTVDGEVALWDLLPSDRAQKEVDKTLLKRVRVHNGGVTCLTAEAGYIITGGMDGHVRFLDHKLRLVAWFEGLNGGPIVSVSLDHGPSSFASYAAIEKENCGRAAQHLAYSSSSASVSFAAPDFMVSTSNAMIIDVSAKAFHTGNPELLRGKLLLQGQELAIQGIAAHPSRPWLAICGLSGTLHIWDYLQKRVMVLSIFRNLRLQSLAFDPTGAVLAVGCTNGTVKILDAATLEERKTFKPQKRFEEVLKMVFSPDGRMLATGTSGGCVGLYELRPPSQGKKPPSDKKSPASSPYPPPPPPPPPPPLEWEFIGYHRTHKDAICAIQFHARSGGEGLRLLSVGQDRRLIEYDLMKSCAEEGLVPRAAHRITQGARPTGFLWTTATTALDERDFPRDDFTYTICEERGSLGSLADSLGSLSEDGLLSPKTRDLLVIATDEYKLSVYTSDWSRQCVKTVLAPTFGGPITGMAVVKNPPSTSSKGEEASSAGAPRQCLFYITKERVIGLVQLPLLGNPRAAVGLLAHPGEIVDMAISHDGRFAFTAGGEDQSVLQWALDGSRILPAEEQEKCDRALANAKAWERGSSVPMGHLVSAIRGGTDGKLMKEIVDYFFYAQIRDQGEETTAEHELLGAVPFAQVPNLMRALGYYPTEMEIGHLTYEVANLYGSRDQMIAEINVDRILLDFGQFLRLYVNYRPVFGISRRDIEQAFLALGAERGSLQIATKTLFDLLGTKGEALDKVEVVGALTSLLGEGIQVDMLEDLMSARLFAQNLLGFEDYDTNSEGERRAPL